MKTVVTVTQDDIENGKKNKSKACPIARALKRNFPKAVEINAGYALYVEHAEGESLLASTAPKSALKFMADFDAGEPVKPFKFSVEFK